MPYNRNKRIQLEEKGGHWFFVLHLNSQAHPSTQGYQTPEEAAREAMVLNSILKIPKGSAERRQRWLEGIKSGPIVEAPKQTEATTQPTAEDWNV
jgi:hypothetical protein